MKTRNYIWAALICFFHFDSANGQEEARLNSHLPIIVSIQFHSLAVPFHHLKSNFKNVGISIGTEMDYSTSSNFHQQFSLIWYHNKAMGNGLILQSQAVWRPYVNDAFCELKAGMGYSLMNRPTNSYKFENGEWALVGKRGKGLLVIPVGIGGGFTQSGDNYAQNHFFGYQIMAVNGYNRTIPILTETLIQFGTCIKKQ